MPIIVSAIGTAEDVVRVWRRGATWQRMPKPMGGLAAACVKCLAAYESLPPRGSAARGADQSALIAAERRLFCRAARFLCTMFLSAIESITRCDSLNSA